MGSGGRKGLGGNKGLGGSKGLGGRKGLGGGWIFERGVWQPPPHSGFQERGAGKSRNRKRGERDYCIISRRLDFWSSGRKINNQKL